MTGEKCAAIASKIGLCGCMEGAAVMRWVRRALQLIADRAAADWQTGAYVHAKNALDAHMRYDPNDEASYENAVYWLLWASLDRAGLIEHGGNVMGAWLTPDGRGFLAALADPPPGWNPEEPLSWNETQDGALVQYAGLP